MKRSPLKRSTTMTSRVPVQRKCKVCRALFAKRSMTHVACSPACAEVVGQAKAAKERAAAERAERRETRERLQALKTRQEWLAEAKLAVQRFRRLEELAAGSGCISCLRTQQEVEGTDGWKPGGAWDGGHFLGKGARPELALEPTNVWLQCKSCNGGSGRFARKGGTVNASFRLNLIDRIGLPAVEALEADHRPRHHGIEDLRAIKQKYTALAREITKGNA